MPTEAPEVTLARIDQRLLAVERDVGRILAASAAARPAWPAVVAALVAAAALVVTLAVNL